jgi:anti-sigma factor RsiW
MGMAQLGARDSWDASSSGQHLLPDAVVAFVDGELSPSAQARAAAHLARCMFCASDVYAQRQARLAVRQAPPPSLPITLLTSLRAIPHVAELPSPPGELGVTADGQFVTVQRSDEAFRSSTGSSRLFGSGLSSLAKGRFGGRGTQR